jgi:hypothetical protein
MREDSPFLSSRRHASCGSSSRAQSMAPKTNEMNKCGLLLKASEIDADDEDEAEYMFDTT